MSKFKWRMDISRLKNGLGQKVKEAAIITGAMGIIAAAVFFFLIPSISKQHRRSGNNHKRDH